MEKDVTATVMQKALEGLAGQSLPDWHRLTPFISQVSLRSGEFLFASYSEHRFCYCVTSGLLKLTYSLEDGREWNKSFVDEQKFFACVSALHPGGLTQYNAVALEATVLEKVDYAAIVSLAERHLAWQRMLTAAFQHYGAIKEQRERELLTLTAQQRYHLFCRERPELLKRIAQHELARYLGITPVALSRIKNRVGPDVRPQS